MGRFILSRPRSSQAPKPSTASRSMSANARVLAHRAKQMEDERLAFMKRRTTRAKFRRLEKLRILEQEFLVTVNGGGSFHYNVAASIMVDLYSDVKTRLEEELKTNASV
jgi:hypothetical protein